MNYKKKGKWKVGKEQKWKGQMYWSAFPLNNIVASQKWGLLYLYITSRKLWNGWWKIYGQNPKDFFFLDSYVIVTNYPW